MPTLDKKAALQLLADNGPLHLSLKNFEPREAQKKMMADILESYENDQIALIEAGTGTGKSLAYLIPALLWAFENKERTLISTQTIALQEQLLFKDIPALLKALNLNLKAVIVKGMNNYICLRKLQEALFEIRLLEAKEAEEITKIDTVAKSTKDGSRTSLPFVPSSVTWEKVSCENDTCNKNECPYYQDCFFFKARKNAQDAQILIANHHLLFADLSFKKEQDNFKDSGLLPSYNRIVLDEAHHIEDVATEYFASRISQNSLTRTLGRLASDKGGKTSVLKLKLMECQDKEHLKTITSINTLLNIDLIALKNDLHRQIYDTFLILAEFASSFGTNDEDFKLRIFPHHLNSEKWLTAVKPSLLKLIESIKSFGLLINHIERDLKSIKNEKFNEQTKGLRFEIQALSNRLLHSAETLAAFFLEAKNNEVKWIENQMYKNATNTLLVNAQLNVAEQLSQFLFKPFSTLILCSATLTSNKKFHFIKDRLGLNLLGERTIIEKVYDSPFNYEKQALFVTLKDLPEPHESSFILAACQQILEALQASRGNAFVLFTSYSMLKECYGKLIKRLIDEKFHVLKQGDDNRKSLLDRFKSQNRSILFGTDSFWEGVDVAGDALRCVILVKLPFKVPTEPIIQARLQAIQEKGGDSFLEYSLPNAIVKFKQGFGRLIRNKSDRGCIVCLDSRLLSKPYGEQFLNSLPPCKKKFLNKEHLRSEMTLFYKNYSQ
jgi:ATP-dependent DNA helicase DinG